MNGLSFGDLANPFMLQQRGAALKIEMAQLTQELTSGQVSDVKNVVAGNYSYLTDIETGLLALKEHKIATTEAS
jgi:flagellar hook-associated protein 3 FlgL